MNNRIHNYEEMKSGKGIFCKCCGDIKYYFISSESNIPATCSTNDKKAKINESVITTSSDYSPNHDSRGCQINYIPTNGHSGSWCAKTNDLNQFIMIDFQKEMNFCGLDLQGRHDSEQWVTSFNLYYKDERNNWISIENNILGCRDRNTIRSYIPTTLIKCRSIRLNPQQWHEHISLRWEVYAQDL
eukprot:TRINITY_DN6143_c0_g2_i1.p1 TRINITY_DN6143_c0_g2~~TRINITY_DN6143_c0_g2_i1.p1  ORF type:complete len:186 (-),score=34.69 TRINITY_DN6143_c0_g2_i1:96-653(-)